MHVLMQFSLFWVFFLLIYVLKFKWNNQAQISNENLKIINFSDTGEGYMKIVNPPGPEIQKGLHKTTKIEVIVVLLYK